MSNLLNWPNWTVIRVEETDSDYRISAQPATPPSVCIFCGTTSLLVYNGYGHAG